MTTLQQLAPTSRDVPAVTDIPSLVAVMTVAKAQDMAKASAEKLLQSLDPDVGQHIDQQA